MSTVAEPTVVTPDELLRMPDGDLYELVDGQLVERNMSMIAAWVGRKVNQQVGSFTDANNLGWEVQSEASYQCYDEDPSRVRRPDGSFIRRGRLAREQLESGYIRIAPDWVLEVLSPNDSAYDVEEKVGEYLRAGVRLIWVVQPEARVVYVYRSNQTVTRLTEADELDGEDVIPGFRCPVRDIFPTAEQLQALSANPANGR